MIGGYVPTDDKLNAISCETTATDINQRGKKGDRDMRKDDKINQDGYHMVMYEGKFVYVPVKRIGESEYIEREWLNTKIYKIDYNEKNIRIV